MDKIPHIHDVDQEIPQNAVRLYGQDNSAMDDFPVLKAFQQYIDTEHSKARKRMILMGVFFCVLMVIVIAVFVGLLISMSSRNQALNDRLVDYVMQERAHPYSAPVVVQPSPVQDVSAASMIASLTSKIEEMQKKLDEKKPVEAEAKPKGPSKEEAEIARLKALLAIEQEKNSAERERRHQEEVEAYRRKYYPEFYAAEGKGKDEPRPEAKRPSNQKNDREAYDSEFDKVIDDIDSLEDDDAIRYFDDEKAAEPPSSAEKAPSSDAAPALQPRDKSPNDDEKYSIPVDVKGSSIDWRIPID